MPQVGTTQQTPCRPGPTAAAPSSASPPRSGPKGGLPGTPLPSTTGSPRAWTASTSRSPYPTRSGTRWATKNEWLGLLDIAGLQVEALYAGFAREPFTDDSREYVFVARRRLSSEGR